MVPVAHENLMWIEALLFLEKVRQFGIAGEDLIACRPFVVGKIVAATIIDGDLDQAAEGAFGLFDTALGVFHAKIQNDAGPRLARPGEKRLLIALDQANRAVNDFPS